jgi:single-stranded-DNA-specific exonuclease
MIYSIHMMLTKLQQIILQNRNIDEKDWDNFLHPDFETGVYDPFLLPDMEKSAERILRAIEKQEKIVIYSDYDCDGIPGGALLRSFFTEIRYENVTNYIPHRHKEGYGLHLAAIDTFIDDGATLIITVDLGITNNVEVEYAQQKGIDVIVTDHHLPHTEMVEGKVMQIIPKAFAVINAKRDDNEYPDTMLCGCATAWKLVCATILRGKEKKKHGFENIGEGFTKWLLDLVAISTIADMVPLVDENRVLAYYGLKVLRKSRRKGIQALALKAGVKLGEVTEDDIAFLFAPRINAASRMDIPLEALKLLLSTDEKTAQDKATYLECLNNSRKTSVASAMKVAYKHMEGRDNQSVIVVGDTTWTPGILGLIASKLKDEYGKTVFVWGRDEDGGDFKGSCRSDGRTHLVDLMQAATPETFSAMGGHELAGGFAVSEREIHDLEERLQDAYTKIEHKPIESIETHILDGELFLSNINKNTLDEINALAPFGIANQKPIFTFNNVVIDEVVLFGKTKNHLKIVVENDGKNIECIQFFSSKEVKMMDGSSVELMPKMVVNVIGSIEQENFGYKRGVRVRMSNIQMSL